MNPYKVLELEPGADKQTVKRAYFKLIRRYTPEKEPEKFKEIREAYEYLQLEDNRSNLQKAEAIPEEFVKPYYQVLEWLKEREYERAVNLCERVLSITELTEFSVLLGRAYIMNGNSGKAVKLWERLCGQQRENREYQEQLGNAYQARGWNKKALDVYYRLYESGNIGISLYGRLLESAMEQEARELVCEAGERVLGIYRQKEGHTREEAESMADILFEISDYIVMRDSQWLLEHAQEMLDIMAEVPTEFELYVNTLLHNTYNLLDILEGNAAVQPVTDKYLEYIASHESSFSGRYEYQLTFVKARIEETKLRQDSLMHAVILETASYWYRLLLSRAELSREAPAELQMLLEEMDDQFDEGSLYDMLLYMANVLKELQPGLARIREHYPLLSRAMGEHLEELLGSSREYLYPKYEKRYKKLMGYPSGARLTLSDKEEDSYDANENGTYRREGAKIGRNDPCPCGSGRKYKQCCGR